MKGNFGIRPVAVASWWVAADIDTASLCCVFTLHAARRNPGLWDGARVPFPLFWGGGKGEKGGFLGPERTGGRLCENDWERLGQQPMFLKDAHSCCLFCQGTCATRAGGYGSTAGCYCPAVVKLTACSWRLPSVLSGNHQHQQRRAATGRPAHCRRSAALFATP